MENAREKIILLDILNISDKKLTEETLSTFVLNEEIMNYFDFRSHLAFLIERGLVHSYDYVCITDEGRSTLSVLRGDIDTALLTRIESSLRKYLLVVKEPIRIEFLGDFAKIVGSKFSITIEGKMKEENFMNSYEKIYSVIENEMEK